MTADEGIWIGVPGERLMELKKFRAEPSKECVGSAAGVYSKNPKR